ncbi:MAG: DUF86 domain-containing protein [Alphaproteobacteria bacterium]|jgi:uncharacterized protein with HEPN domain|nr:DUF86 domain-containing protein [Alphaproteobacteria bacterium]MBU1548828.1 DUF86 domain-containing protein [Alphaproteobacteria bacterium]MBU2335654.1 DUF86 domain-containing protein [Alphaproteobacteria bacterium]MBU2390951.1 DUF86 domain-containing protein [Alphaproteobacteria bacterium]|tara:strand:- start:22 stop:384 length:363 start_codon:yes stop_codon:yes gene_type:complete
MSDDRLPIYLERMAAAAKTATGYTRGMDRAAFFADQRTQDAVVANIMAIGECVIKLMDAHPELIADHPQIAWKDICNMRNRIAHQYFQLDVDTIWLTVNSFLPDLLDQLHALTHWRPQGE